MDFFFLLNSKRPILTLISSEDIICCLMTVSGSKLRRFCGQSETINDFNMIDCVTKYS